MSKSSVFRLFNKVYAPFGPLFHQLFVISHKIFLTQQKTISMKKYIVLCAGLCLAMSFTSCKSSDKAYRQAYDKALQQAATQNQYETPVVQQVQTVTPTNTTTPVQTQPVTQTQVVDNYDNVQVRREQVTVVNGSGLQDYSVVVASMSIIANAEGLQQRLKNGGYSNAQIVKSIANGKTMYRVVAATYASKADAARMRDAIRGTEFNPQSDAWLLYNIK